MYNRQLSTINVIIVGYLAKIFAKNVCEFDKINSFLKYLVFILLILIISIII